MRDSLDSHLRLSDSIHRDRQPGGKNMLALQAKARVLHQDQ
jgi:hypothetical protein